MEKRFQVFVSSTYSDLKSERQSVIQTLMEMDCIPAGMELFPAADEDQFEFIKKVIDDCDYYILLIGGRYGSITEEGISYTEMEFDYAVSKGIRIVALLHESPDEISVDKSDINEELRAKLIAFREKVCSGRMVKFWNSAKEVAGLVALSMTKTIKVYPAVGWVRANLASQREATEEILTLTKKVSELEKDLEKAVGKHFIDREKLARGNDPVTVEVSYCMQIKNTDRWPTHINVAEGVSQITSSWNDIYSSIAPTLIPFTKEASVKNRINSLLEGIGFDSEIKSKKGQTLKFKGITPIAMDLVRMQFTMLGYITVEKPKDEKGRLRSPVWNLTELGRAEMVKLVATLRD